MRILDLFCGAGGCAVGYDRAGFDVFGIDINPQPNYPFDFWQASALEALEELAEGGHLMGYRFDAIHASPPCQGYASVTHWRGNQDDHPRLIEPTRGLLWEVGLPYVIENVVTRHLRSDFMLCGTQFGLPFRRHRFFETSWHPPHWTEPCHHRPEDYSFDHGGKQPESVYRDAMGCGWMTVQESREAIPPAYTEHIGTFLKQHIGQEQIAA